MYIIDLYTTACTIIIMVQSNRPIHTIDIEILCTIFIEIYTMYAYNVMRVTKKFNIAAYSRPLMWSATSKAPAYGIMVLWQLYHSV